jgi:hypothetical protein
MINSLRQATDFIVNNLSDFIKLFPQTRVRYEFDTEANVHCIEVVPNHVYHLNSEYIAWENQLSDSFIELFSNQNICFFSEDAIIGINNIQYEFIGKQYLNIISINDFIPITSNLIHVSNSSSNFDIVSLSTSIKVFNTTTTNKINQNNLVIDPANSITSIINQNQSLFFDNYSMAA